MSFCNFFVTSIRSVDQQRNSLQRRWRRLATEDAGVEKLPDCVIKAYNITFYVIDFSSDKANKAMMKKTKEKKKTLDRKPGPTQPEDSGGKYHESWI